MTLPTRPLGSTGMNITRVGLGAWAMGGGEWAFAWGAQDDSDSIATIRRAVDLGVNWIDTAAVYGLGHSEEVVARALRDMPEAERPYVFTKGGVVWNEDDRTAPTRRHGSPDSLRRELDNSLRRLGVERIDLYQMHWPAEDGTQLDEYWQVFLDARDAGKVRAIGLSNHGTGQLAEAEGLGHVDTLQPPFSAIRAGAADSGGVLEWCSTHNTGVIVYSPMGSGLLTGAFTAERVAALPKDDWRGRSPEFTDNLAKNLQTSAAMAAVAQERGVAQGAVAVAWTLGFPGVTGAIVGARTPEQIDGWIEAADLELTPEEYRQIGTVTP
jgi:aryl-alcohol dehydrogenase-like predicted oxidoreductase